MQTATQQLKTGEIKKKVNTPVPSFYIPYPYSVYVATFYWPVNGWCGADVAHRVWPFLLPQRRRRRRHRSSLCFLLLRFSLPDPPATPVFSFSGENAGEDARSTDDDVDLSTTPVAPSSLFHPSRRHCPPPDQGSTGSTSSKSRLDGLDELQIEARRFDARSLSLPAMPNPTPGIRAERPPPLVAFAGEVLAPRSGARRTVEPRSGGGQWRRDG